MKKFLVFAALIALVGCSEDSVVIPDNKADIDNNRAMIEANKAMIEANREMIAILQSDVADNEEDIQRLEDAAREAYRKLTRKIRRISRNQIDVVSCGDFLLLDTPDGLIGPVLSGRYRTVVTQQGEFVPERTYCVRRHPFWGFCVERRTEPAHISEGETRRIFEASGVSLQEVSCREER